MLYLFFRRLTHHPAHNHSHGGRCFGLGLMIAFGHPLHILSSMLQFFHMPSPLRFVHHLSDFLILHPAKDAARPSESHGRLFAPILYTS